jgi:hypothetical protein
MPAERTTLGPRLRGDDDGGGRGSPVSWPVHTTNATGSARSRGRRWRRQRFARLMVVPYDQRHWTRAFAGATMEAATVRPSHGRSTRPTPLDSRVRGGDDGGGSGSPVSSPFHTTNATGPARSRGRRWRRQRFARLMAVPRDQRHCIRTFAGTTMEAAAVRPSHGRSTRPTTLHPHVRGDDDGGGSVSPVSWPFHTTNTTGPARSRGTTMEAAADRPSHRRSIRPTTLGPRLRGDDDGGGSPVSWSFHTTNATGPARSRGRRLRRRRFARPWPFHATNDTASARSRGRRWRRQRFARLMAGPCDQRHWVPAFAGTTMEAVRPSHAVPRDQRHWIRAFAGTTMEAAAVARLVARHR